MLIIPAIDIKGGAVVRLVRGRGRQTVYSDDPIKTAKHWVKQGARFLHIVDLDAAIKSKFDNLGLIKKIPAVVGIPVEIGGGIRTQESIAKLLKCGFSRVVLGTRAAQDAHFLRSAFKRFKDRIIVSIDAQRGKILTKGWRAQQPGLNILDFLESLKKIGFRQVIYTDTLRDGTLKGPNIKALKDVLKTGIRVIVSGGISSLRDLRQLKALEKKGLAGVIVGKALYEGRFTLAQALKC